MAFTKQKRGWFYLSFAHKKNDKKNITFYPLFLHLSGKFNFIFFFFCLKTFETFMWFFYFIWPVIYISIIIIIAVIQFLFFFYCNKIIRSIFISSSYTLIIISRRVCVCACDRDQSTSHTHTQTVWKKRTLHWWNICLIFESIDFCFVFYFRVYNSIGVFLFLCVCVCVKHEFFFHQNEIICLIYWKREKKKFKTTRYPNFFCCCWLSSSCNAFITES